MSSDDKDSLSLLLSSWQSALSLGDSLSVDERYDEAVDAYAAALALLSDDHKCKSSFSFRYRALSHRAQAFLRLQRYSEALQDTNDASALLAIGSDGASASASVSVSVSVSTSSQTQIKLRPGETELCLKRQAEAHVGLRHYEEAQTVLKEAMQLAQLNHRPTEKYQQLLDQCKEATTTTTAAATAEAAPPVATITPNQKLPSSSSTSGSSSTAITTTTTTTTTTPTPTQQAATAAAVTVTAPTPTALLGPLPAAPKYQYYQSDKVMTIVVLRPNLSRDDLIVDFHADELTVSIRHTDGRHIPVISGFLYEKVLPEQCKIAIKSEKALIKLRKEKDNYEWPELLSKRKKKETAATTTNKPAAAAATATTATKTVTTEEARAIAEGEKKEAPPAATNGSTEDKSSSSARKIPPPYSSHKNWDAIEKEIEEKEKNEVPEGDDATKKLFEHIYQNADEDTRRAMIKSYQTSGGTVLSTNWDEVSSKNYEEERTAPKGMEWKTWEGQKLPTKDDD